MLSTTLLSIYERIEALADRLPGPLQKPVLSELRPIKQIFLARRPARLAILGQPAADASALLSALLGSELRLIEPAQGSGWISYEHKGKGGFWGLDGRTPDQTGPSSTRMTSILAEDAPDACLFLVDGAKRADLGPAFDQASRFLEFVRQRFNRKIPLIAVIDFPDQTPAETAEKERAELQARFADHAGMAACFVRAIAVSSFVRFRQDGTIDPERDQRKNIRELASSLAMELPEEAQVEAARLLGAKDVQRDLAGRLVRSVTAINAAIGAQPIPLADFPVLTTLQVAMVSGIMHVSGRELSVKAATEFLGALGMNIGAAMVLREGVRAAVKALPGWGNAISGGVAAAGTYGIGRAASAYFIDGAPLSEVRRFMKTRNRPGKRRAQTKLTDLDAPEKNGKGKKGL